MSGVSGTIRLAALLSGGGRTLLNLLDAIERGDLDASVECVIASRPDAPGIARLQERGIDVAVIAGPDGPERDDAVSAAISAADADLVVLCGYLRYLRIDDDLQGRVLNIHPSLLPLHGGRGMYGDRVHAAVLAAGDPESGCTVHLVDEVYDQGPIIVQRRCAVMPEDTVQTLADRVFEHECIAYPLAIEMVARGGSVPKPTADS